MTPSARRWPRPRATAPKLNTSLLPDGLDGSRQLDLFTAPPAVRPTDPPTSHAVAVGNTEHRARIRQDVLRQHQLHPDGLTDDQTAELLPDDHPPSLVKRRGELVRDGVLVDSGRRLPTRRSSMAIVWVLAEDEDS